MVLQRCFKSSPYFVNLIWGVCIVLLAVYKIYSPEKYGIFPRCPFKLLTTFDCAGCGSQRAIHHLLNSQINNAFEANAFLVTSIPFIILFAVAERLQTKNSFAFKLNKLLFSKQAIWLVFSLVILWWIGRNVI